MAKVKLGARPKNFKRELKFTMIDGSIGSMEVTYTYRTRKEIGAFADETQAKIKAALDVEIEAVKKAGEAGDDLPEFKQSDSIARQDEFNVDYVMESVEGWNLDIPFDREAVEQLAEELPAAITAIIGTYRDAILEGRLGN